jgi:uncharacterized membrane protein YfcA
MSWLEIAVLIFSGILVGFINTLAGGGSIISLSILIFFGLPATVANGTNRIAITLQTLIATGSFKQQKVLDHKKGLLLAIPAIIGSIIGAQIAADIDEVVFERAIAVIIIVMMIFILYKPQRWLIGKEELMKRKISIWQILLFLVIGFYGGFIHVGVGYLLLGGIVLGAGYDLVKANAIKVLIVLLYAPFTLVIFILNDQVNYKLGFTLAIGNIIGAFIASRMAVSWGANFVRIVIVVVVVFTSMHLFGIVNVKDFINSFLYKELL